MVKISACPSYDKNDVVKALENTVDLSWVKSGMKIGIKANLVTFLKPDAAATTHPALLVALTQMLVDRGAEVVVGDSPGGIYNGIFLDRVYSATGMKALTEVGGKLNRDFSVRQAEFENARVCKTFSYTGWLDNCDEIINFCKLKTHGMMSMSGASKNMFGAVPGTVKPEYHYRFPEPADFADMIIDLDEYFKPRLSIVDAVVGMEGNGPTAGTPRHIGMVIASKNPHAADLVGATVIGLDPKEVPTLVAALRRGLVCEKVGDLDISGGNLDDFIIPDYQLVKTTRSLRFSRDSEQFFGKLFSRIADRALASYPKLNHAKCVGCRECEKVCPADAIVMKDKKPVINRKKCIRCFCCQEFCPKSAMTVHRPPLARILTK